VLCLLDIWYTWQTACILVGQQRRWRAEMELHRTRRQIQKVVSYSRINNKLYYMYHSHLVSSYRIIDSLVVFFNHSMNWCHWLVDICAVCSLHFALCTKLVLCYCLVTMGCQLRWALCLSGNPPLYVVAHRFHIKKFCSRRTDSFLVASPRWHSMQRAKNGDDWSKQTRVCTVWRHKKPLSYCISADHPQVLIFHTYQSPHDVSDYSHEAKIFNILYI